MQIINTAGTFDAVPQVCKTFQGLSKDRAGVSGLDLSLSGWKCCCGLRVGFFFLSLVMSAAGTLALQMDSLK